MQYITVNTEPEDRERSKTEVQSLWMDHIICRYCIRIPAKIMYHRYIWMDIVCRDDEKRNRETGSFFGDFRTSLSAGISRLFGMFLFALY